MFALFTTSYDILSHIFWSKYWIPLARLFCLAGSEVPIIFLAHRSSWKVTKNVLHQINVCHRGKQDFNNFACFPIHVILFRTIEHWTIEKKFGWVVLAEWRICSPEKSEFFQLLGDIRPEIGNCWMNCEAYFDFMMIKLSCLQYKFGKGFLTT